jgi:uncharacterized protein
MLIDVHAHFHHPAGSRIDWADRNASRLAAGETMGITCHVASILGSWGRTSPTYFPSPMDVTVGNDATLELVRLHPTRIRAYACVNPNFTEHALTEIDRCLALGMVGVKLAASRRADDPRLDPVVGAAAGHGVPVLQHIWQDRRHEWPGQEASDAAELARLARRHPTVAFILAHIGGGGDWLPSLRTLRSVPNVWVDLSGSGVDGGMLEACLAHVGVDRLVWGADLTLCTGLAKLRYLERLLTEPELEKVRWRNAAGIFPAGSFGDG